MDKWYKRIIGARTLKTGVATFFTTLFCMLLNLNPIFAILTAIVTIEPTAKASIKKGYRRLPATVIGALLAVIFTFIFGDQSPFTYALSATFTILLCTKFNLQVGTTVAVLTSVAMIPGIHEAYVFNFFSRLLTAVIGLSTAALVNFIILPPKYFEQIDQDLIKSEDKIYQLFSSRTRELLLGKYHSEESNKQLSELTNLYNKIETLIGYQKDELYYHKSEDEWAQLNDITNHAHINRLMITHLSNIIYLPKNVHLVFSAEEKIAIMKISQSIKDIIENGSFTRERRSASALKTSVKLLDEFDENQVKSHVIYEILMIYKTLDNRYA